MKSQPFFKHLIQLWHHISQHRRIQFGFLLLLMILTSFAEILSIGTVLPFLGILTDPESVFTHPSSQKIIQILGITDQRELLFPLTLAFGIAAITAGLMRLLLLWFSTNLSFATGADLSISIYRRTLYQPYAVHVSRNSSEVINGISTKANSVIYSILMPALTLISSSVMLVAILIALFAVDPIVAVTAFGGFALIYSGVIILTRKRLLLNSKVVAIESTNVIKSLQEGLGGIRDVLIDSSQDTYCQIYRNADLALRRAQGDNFFLSSSPRFAMEALGMLLIAIIAFSMADQSEGISKAIPVLGALALGAQRLLPALQQAYNSWSMIQGGQASLQDTLYLLDQPIPNHAVQLNVPQVNFQKNITLKKLSFRYEKQSNWVLKNIDFTISKGAKVGFIGVTGSGKSTLLDIVMALLEPTEGSIEVDGLEITALNQNAWQLHIAHVPQAIFLADTTVEENIAFGVPKEKINIKRVQLAARKAQIDDCIESWPNKYQTIVGERGVRLSGGQRQRIGIARALYKQAEVIIFDEATSALDMETEQAVMQAINGLSKELTILIIAHRLSTLQNCTQIVELKNGGINRIGSYQDLQSNPTLN